MTTKTEYNLCDNKDRKTWNVKKAEEEIKRIKSIANFFIKDELEEVGLKFLENIYPDESYRQLIIDAAKEMADIINNKKNNSGYHINHITSGKSVYCVYSTEGDKSYTTDGVHYISKEEAEAVVTKYDEDDAYTEELHDSSGTYWLVWTYDEEATEIMKKDGYRHFVEEYDTLEEAEAEAAEHENGTVEEEPSEEWFAVTHNETGKRAYDILFPYLSRALAFLYKAAAPEAWVRYREETYARLKNMEENGNV